MYPYPVTVHFFPVAWKEEISLFPDTEKYVWQKKYHKATHLVRSPRRQADKTDSLLEVGLSVKFEQGDVIVQRLAVVVVVDVGGGHSEGLGPRAPVLLSQIMVTYTNIDGVTSPDDAEKRGNYICVAFYESYFITRI